VNAKAPLARSRKWFFLVAVEALERTLADKKTAEKGQPMASKFGEPASFET
jgi:hypothetical protein